MTRVPESGMSADRIGRLRTSNYDISNVCNLRCDGCLYFSGAGQEIQNAQTSIAVWREFFASEARRGINFAYVAGAEPSLTPDRIRACHEHIPMGVIFTNGTKRIADDIDYRIHVSVWGDEAGSTLYRGANINRKAMRNYAGDERAVFVMTLNAQNLAEVPSVASACRDHGLKLTFSLFSPTMEYNKYPAVGEAGDLRLTPADLNACRDTMLEAEQRYPDTIRISREFVDWVTGGESLYTIDETGVATDCGNRLTRSHVHFNADLGRNSGKCCSPNLDCRDCRPYAMSLATYFNRRRQRPEEWPRVWSFWSELFLPVKRHVDARPAEVNKPASAGIAV